MPSSDAGFRLVLEENHIGGNQHTVFFPHTVDGRSPAPPDMVETLEIMVVQFIAGHRGDSFVLVLLGWMMC